MAIRMLRDLHEVARSANLRVTEIDGWKDRTRPASTGSFKPEGVLIHHTGGTGNGIDTARWLAVTGRPDEGIPAPLAQLALNRQGIVYILAAGRANHAGDIDAVRPWLEAGDGNAQLVGIEAMNTGAEGWTDDQYDAYVRLCAALCEAYGWPASHVLGHKEVAPTRKVDPGKMNLDRFREGVHRLITTNGDDVAEDVWLRKIKRLDEVAPDQPAEIPAGQMLAQTHNRAGDARVAAGGAATSAQHARDAANAAKAAAQQASAEAVALTEDVATAVRLARAARDAAQAGRTAAEATRDALLEGSWGFEPADQADRMAAEAIRDDDTLAVAQAVGAADLDEPAGPGTSRRQQRKIKRQRRRAKSMRPREYRKATRAAVVPSVVGVLGLLWQNGWDVQDLTQEQVSVLVAAASAAFAIVFGTANADPED